MAGASGLSARARLVVGTQQRLAERVVQVNAGKGHLVAAVAVGEVLAVFRLAGIVAEVLGDGDVLLVQDIGLGSRRATKARARANSRWPAARGRCSAPAIGSPRPAWRTPACSLPPGSRRNRARCARRRRSRPAYGRESRRRRCAATLSPGRSRPPASGRELIHRGRAAWLPPEMRRASTRRPEAAAMRPRYP